MMNKKWLPHIIAVVSLALFVVLGLASDGSASTPSSYSSGGGGEGINTAQESTYLVQIAWEALDGRTGRHAYNIKATSASEAENEATWKFGREFNDRWPTYVLATKIY